MLQPHLLLPLTYVSTLFVEGDLQKMKQTKSTRIDDLPTGMLKDCRTLISTPLAFIINISLQTLTVPSEWKTALITPIHKKGTQTDENNYRPISILPVVSKILEKAVQQQLMDHLESNDLVSINSLAIENNAQLELLLLCLLTTFIKLVIEDLFLEHCLLTSLKLLTLLGTTTS